MLLTAKREELQIARFYATGEEEAATNLELFMKEKF
jgi:hypothetical protein